MGNHRTRPVLLAILASISAAMCASQSEPASPPDTFEQMLSQPAAVRMLKLLRQANTVVIGTVGWRGVVADPDGTATPEYDVAVIECLKYGNVCPVQSVVQPPRLRVRSDTDALAFTAPGLGVNQHYILFLCRPADAAYYITCGNQGIFRLVRNWGDWEWTGGTPYARMEDEIEVLSTVPSFVVYNRMSFWEFSQELAYLPQVQIPLTQLNLPLLLANHLSRSHAARIIEDCKVNFDLTPDLEAELREKGADREILTAIGRSRAKP